MDAPSLQRELHRLILQHYPRAPKELSSEMRFEQELGGDSLDIVELVMAIEKGLEVALSDEEVGRIKTVGELMTLVLKNRRAN